MHKSDGYTYSFGELVKQKNVNFVRKQKVEQVLASPVQLSMFDISELETESKSQTKRIKPRKFDGVD
ncbi:MAG: hypothetical protein WBA93_10795 [Microcoleaceae cyanobacterium]